MIEWKSSKCIDIKAWKVAIIIKMAPPQMEPMEQVLFLFVRDFTEEKENQTWVAFIEKCLFLASLASLIGF